MKKDKLFKVFLNKLGFKYTDYTLQEFRDFPLNRTLLGWSVILDKLGFRNRCSLVSEIEDLNNIQLPCLSIKDNQFVIIEKIKNGQIFYTSGQNSVEDIEEFKKGWTNHILEITGHSNTTEFNYKFHKYSYIVNNIIKLFIFLILFLFAVYIFLDFPIENIIPLSLNLLGVFISIIIYIKYLKLDNKLYNKLCHIKKKHDCDKFIYSKDSKIFKLFSLSEIGLHISSQILYLQFALNTIFSHSCSSPLLLYSFVSGVYGNKNLNINLGALCV